MQPQQQNPYGFIFDPGQSRQRGPSFIQDPRRRKLTMVLFVAGILLLVLIVGSLVFGGGNNTDDLRELAAQQSEVSRISALGIENAKTPEVRALAATVQAVLASDTQQTVGYLEKVGVKLSERQLAARTNAKRTEQLQAAISQNTFDQVFEEILAGAIADYKQSLQTSLNAASTPQRKAVVETAAKNILLIENAN